MAVNKKHKKTFSMWSEVLVRTNEQIAQIFYLKYANTVSQNGMIFSILSILKLLNFFPHSECTFAASFRFLASLPFYQFSGLVLFSDLQIFSFSALLYYLISESLLVFWTVLS